MNVRCPRCGHKSGLGKITCEAICEACTFTEPIKLETLTTPLDVPVVVGKPLALSKPARKRKAAPKPKTAKGETTKAKAPPKTAKPRR